MSDTPCSYLYLLIAACSYCGNVAKLVEERETSVPMMQSVEIVSTHYCPECGEFLDVDQWDVQEEAYVKRTQDPTEAV